jgi:hypothetical protein
MIRYMFQIFIQSCLELWFAHTSSMVASFHHSFNTCGNFSKLHYALILFAFPGLWAMTLLYIKPISRYFLYITIPLFNFQLISATEINILTKEIMPMIRKNRSSRP